MSGELGSWVQATNGYNTMQVKSTIPNMIHGEVRKHFKEEVPLGPKPQRVKTFNAALREKPMKAEDRFDTIRTELENLITPMSEMEQDMLMKAIRWACRDNKCGRMSALAQLLVWQDPNTTVGGIWCMDDVDAYLENLTDNTEFDIDSLTLKDKQEMLDDWYHFISQNESNLWEDFIYSRLEWHNT
jgi:hypothetical protein